VSCRVNLVLEVFDCLAFIFYDESLHFVSNSSLQVRDNKGFGTTILQDTLAGIDAFLNVCIGGVVIIQQ
jgi:hypothetical protein